ncbi:MAG: hypothetical protein HYU41_23885 [Candidatus Rokubacteria bacterium]|nr:hypothetical protein [Candidatus Rokubacteria bacterium]
MTALLPFLAAVVLVAAGTPVFAADAPSPAGIRACQRTPRPDDCLDGLFRTYLAARSTADALRLVETYSAEHADLRMGCHPIVHAVGRETFRVRGSVHESFAACDGTCHSGCYHGVIERFLGPTSAGHVSHVDLERKAGDICRGDFEPFVKFQCVHGVGHALMFFTGYHLDHALGVCDRMGDRRTQRICYGGVFMENLTSATPEKRDVKGDDYHYPCSRLAPKYQPDCYLMQTSRMGEMGLWTNGMFVECARAGPFRSECATSIGRDLSNYVRGDGPEFVATQCQWRVAADRYACINGVVKAVIDNTWDLRYALPFCAALGHAEDRGHCLRTSVRYLVVNRKLTAADAIRQCRQHFPHGRTCAAVAVSTQAIGSGAIDRTRTVTSSK